MKRSIMYILTVFSLILLTGACATHKNATVPYEGYICVQPVKKVRIPEVFGTQQIKDWYAIDNKTIVIDTYSYGKFKGTFCMSCYGIPFTDTIGIRTQGPFALDKNTIIVLSDGETCFFQDLVPYSEEDEEKEEGKSEENP